MDLVLLLLVAGVVLFISYLVSLTKNPHRDCWWCGGKPGRSGWFFWWSRGACERCGGTGKHLRWGRKVWDRSRGRG